MQNALIAGLLTGSIVGSNLFLNQSKIPAGSVSIDGAGGRTGWLGEALKGSSHHMFRFIRVISGYSSVLTMRVVVKAVTTQLFKIAGLDVSTGGADKAEEAPGGRRTRSDSFEMHAWVLFGRATIKFVTYTSIAIMIVHTCPLMFETLGIYSQTLADARP
jgi:hypothetical protein